jgi:DnaK suppressor protein
MSSTPEQLTHFRERLERLHDELLEIHELAKDGTKPVPLDQTTVGRLSRMEAIQAQAMSAATQQRREYQLQRVKQALNRVAAGEYGLCESCDEPIELRRLEFDPAGTLCLECAKQRERG